MKRRRGLKRYYQNLGKKDFIEKLDFSESENSWFDLYHIHIDNTGLGNKSWKSRKQHLDALFLVSEKIEGKLKNYSKEFQYWIEIDENDSFEDSIYIHTKNPNKSEFPEKLDFDSLLKSSYQELEKYLNEKDFIINKKKLFDENGKPGITYFLQKEDLGIKL